MRLRQHVAQRNDMAEPDRRPAAEGRVGARPGVADRHESGDDRLIVDPVLAVTVLDPGEDVDVGERLSVDPVRGEGVAAHDAVEHIDPAKGPQRLVGGAGDDRHAPRSVVRRERHEGHRVVRLHGRRLGGWDGAVGGAEVPGVVHEAVVIGMLDRPSLTELRQPARDR